MEPLPLIVIAAAVLVPLIWAIAIYNSLTRLSQHIRESWADIDVELKRRYDLIPNLVETVKGYATHERETLQKVIELRNRAAASNGPANEQGRDETALQLGMAKLFAVAEAYPQLKADAQFLALQKELANTEDRVAAARRFYNANVRDYNRLVQTVPTNLIASAGGFKANTYFELSDQAERVVPAVRV